MTAWIWIRGPRRQWGFHAPAGPALFSERYGYRKTWRFLGMKLNCQKAKPDVQPRIMLGMTIGRWSWMWHPQQSQQECSK